MADDLAALLEEQQRRQGQITIGTRSVLAAPEETTTFEEFKRATESLLKGGAKGVVDLAGGWGNVYDAFKENKEPGALSSVGIANAIAKAGGPDIMKIQGYKGAYDVGQAAAPAMLLSAGGLPGMFGRSLKGIAAEGAVAGGTGLAAQTIAPDSPLSQFVMQTAPYALVGGVKQGRAISTAPSGMMPSNVDELLQVGRMTPGEAGGNRPQLAQEARVEANPKIEERGNVFRQAQARDVESFLTDVFKRANPSTIGTEQASTAAIDAFKNYGKALSGTLRRDAAADFKAARLSGGKVDTTPILFVIEEKLSAIPPEVAALDPLKNALNRIKNEYVIEGTPEITTASSILGPTGQPASVKVTPAVPASAMEIDIDRLQKNLSAWGEAAYSGKADFGKGNIFEGVAPGQAKGIAISVLGGFRDALDNAIQQGVPGADKLVKARDNFKANLSKIEEFSNRPLAKYFDVATASELVPENVIDKLSKAKPSERQFLVDVLQNSSLGLGVWDTVRKAQLDSLIDKATKAAAGAAEGSPSIDLKVLLKELNNKKGDFGYLLPSAQAQSDVTNALTWLQKVNKSASEVEQGNKSAYAASRSLGATSQQGLLLQEVSGLIRTIFENPKTIANVVFDDNTVKSLADAQKKGLTRKTLETILGGLKVATQTAVRAGPRLGAAVPPTSPNASQELDDLQALLEEEARRKQ
jgi:hypothetical protein